MYMNVAPGNVSKIAASQGGTWFPMTRQYDRHPAQVHGPASRCRCHTLQPHVHRDGVKAARVRLPGGGVLLSHQALLVQQRRADHGAIDREAGVGDNVVNGDGVLLADNECCEDLGDGRGGGRGGAFPICSADPRWTM